MGLDLRPMGKPKPNFEKRFFQIINIIEGNEKQELSFIDKLFGKKLKTKDELLKEWFGIQINPLDTIKAPKVGRDRDAEVWLLEQYNNSAQSISIEEFKKQYEGYYVIEYAQEQDGIPIYNSPMEDQTSFRGEFLRNCIDLIGEELVIEAWSKKIKGKDALDYGNRLLAKANSIASAKGLLHLKEQREAPSGNPESVESKLHIVYSLSRWLIFYGKNGHGYDAYF